MDETSSFLWGGRKWRVRTAGFHLWGHPILKRKCESEISNIFQATPYHPISQRHVAFLQEGDSNVRQLWKCLCYTSPPVSLTAWWDLWFCNREYNEEARQVYSTFWGRRLTSEFQIFKKSVKLKGAWLSASLHGTVEGTEVSSRAMSGLTSWFC